MRSLRSKLIFVVVFITVSSFLTVMISNLQLIKKDKQESLRTANRQVSELVSRFVLTQISEYQRGLNYIFSAWKDSTDFKIQSEYFPDYVWVQLIDWQGNPVFEWADSKHLAKANLSVDRLLGKRNRDTLFSEVKQVLSKTDDWLLFNSTIDPFMPTFLLASSVSKPGDDKKYVALAEIYAEPLFNQVHAREGQQLILIDSHENVLLSTRPGWNPSEIAFTDQKSLSVIKTLGIGGDALRTIDYPGKGAQLTSFYKLKAGHGLTLMLQEPAANLVAGQRRIQLQSAIVGLIVLLIVINLIVWFAHRITSPLKKLTNLMAKAGKGEFTGHIKVNSKDEIGKLAQVFNKMIHDLNSRDEEVNRAKQKLIQSEKMSAFGQMSAGIAHEVKNPLAGILGYAQMAKKKLDDRPEISSYMEIIEKETTRCKEIVENLMRFARQEKASLHRINMNKTVQDSVRLVEHQITVSGIKIVQMYAHEGKPIFIEGNANQIQQVMLNLMLNAQHAMENKGTLTVSTHFDDKNKRILIMVSDTGCGIPPDVQARIFEPFFTTKGIGKGTGLGLSVSLGIIKDHKGTVDVDSTEGKGTTFTISLPVAEDIEGIDSEKEDSATESAPKNAGAAS